MVDRVEAAPEVEFPGVRIADYIKDTRFPGEGNLRAVFDKRPSNATPPEIRLNEQAVELRIAIGSGLQRGEAGNTAAQFQDEHIPQSNLPDGQINGIGIGENRLTVARIRQGRTELEALKRRLLRNNGAANCDRFHGWSLNGDAGLNHRTAAERSFI